MGTPDDSGGASIGDVVEVQRPAVGAGPPGNRAIVIGLLVTHPDAEEVWTVWPNEPYRKLAPGDALTAERIREAVAGARAKYYRVIARGALFVGGILKSVLGDGA